MGDNNAGLKSAVRRWFNHDWKAEEIRKLGFALPIKRGQVLANIRDRQGQGWFRRQLLLAYRGACAVSGCEFENLLDACHIDPASQPTSVHSVENGILLRTDLHTLFDLGYLAIHPRDRTVWISPAIRDSNYTKLRGTEVRSVDTGFSGPDKLELLRRWKGRKLRG
jgi:predicted restriction endonuclease